LNIGLIGAGAIARFLLEEVNLGQQDNMKITSIYVRNREKYQELEAEFGITLYTDLKAFLDAEIDIVVEAANVETVKTLLPDVVRKKRYGHHQCRRTC
jgi:aspartate dehydrogenase